MGVHLEHIGIAVHDLGEATQTFAKLLGVLPYKEELVPNEGVKTVFFSVGNTKIELLGSLKKESAVEKFLSKRGEGLHHIALSVPDIEKHVKILVEKGFEFVNSEPKTGADHKRVCFLHPKKTHRTLIELCQ